MIAKQDDQRRPYVYIYTLSQGELIIVTLLLLNVYNIDKEFMRLTVQNGLIRQEGANLLFVFSLIGNCRKK